MRAASFCGACNPRALRGWRMDCAAAHSLASPVPDGVMPTQVVSLRVCPNCPALKVTGDTPLSRSLTQATVPDCVSCLLRTWVRGERATSGVAATTMSARASPVPLRSRCQPLFRLAAAHRTWR